MSGYNFEKLIERYSEGRKICNCKQAYYTNNGHARINGVDVYDYPVCDHGCSSNQIRAKEYIADRVVEEFGIK